MEDMPECSNCCLQLETDLEEEELCFIVNSKEDLDIKYKMEDSLNKQINAELYSGYLYLSMSAFFESMNI